MPSTLDSRLAYPEHLDASDVSGVRFGPIPKTKMSRQTLVALPKSYTKQNTNTRYQAVTWQPSSMAASPSSSRRRSPSSHSSHPSDARFLVVVVVNRRRRRRRVACCSHSHSAARVQQQWPETSGLCHQLGTYAEASTHHGEYQQPLRQTSEEDHCRPGGRPASLHRPMVSVGVPPQPAQSDTRSRKAQAAGGLSLD